MKPINYLELAQSKASNPSKPAPPDDQDEDDNPEDMPGQIALLSSILKRMAHKHAAADAKSSKGKAADTGLHPSIPIMMASKTRPTR